MDIVSRNGNLMLNFPLPNSGSAPPSGVLIELDVLIADHAKHHRRQPPVVHRQSLRPRAGRLLIPELQRIVILRETQTGACQRRGCHDFRK
jgi:hypothetical protein